jgi:hypothetical protein
MPADSIPAAHSALTEMSAHPVSKSSFKKESTPSRVHPKEASHSNSTRTGNVRDGSFATDTEGLAYRLMSASVRKRPTSGVAAKRRDGPQTDSRIAAFLVDHVASATCREVATDRLQFPLKPRGMLRARGGRCAIKVQPPAGATTRLRVAFCPVPAFH